MPANLPPHYFAAEKEYKNAKTIPEKIAALEEMLAIMPHHKGTDKLRAGLTRKIAHFREQAESHAQTKRGSVFSIDKQGASQVILVGTTSTGKSSLLSVLTHAAPEIAPYPYTTAVPMIGMMPYEDIQIQIVDLPPVSGEVRRLPYYNLLRNADLLLVVASCTADPGVEVPLLLEELEEGKVYSHRIAVSELPIGAVRKRMLVALNKCDGADAVRSCAAVSEALGDEIDVIAVSSRSGEGIEDLKVRIFTAAEIIRIYTKVPGRKADMGAPYVLPAGSTVMDLARSIHKDFAVNLRSARVWGSARFDGQPVHHDHVLVDGDIVELHM
ncbi:MAG TPA: TGS domain-containing protein [Patescibacteria group bacterium]|nr:TGS domain-containing protein [Patescibacteria group bacterium]